MTKPIDAIDHMLQEYKRPWKLFTLLVGLSLLIAGSFYYQAVDASAKLTHGANFS